MLRRFLNIIITLSSLLFSLPGIAENIPFGGIEKLQLPNKMELSVATEKDFDFVDEQGARRYWKTTLTLKKEKKVLWQKIHREDKEERWVYGNIVPIRKGKYFDDLNHDGQYEVAILPWDFEMAVYRTAEIYTVKDDELVKYGEGRFNFEFGPNVLFGCMRCSKFDAKECEKCL